MNKKQYVKPFVEIVLVSPDLLDGELVINLSYPKGGSDDARARELDGDDSLWDNSIWDIDEDEDI